MTRHGRDPERRQEPPPRHARASELRDAIDGGRTGDKVRVEDPSAAPLGTDDEAAGQAPAAEEVRLAMAQETGRAPARPVRDGRSLLALTVAGAISIALLAAALAWGI